MDGWIGGATSPPSAPNDAGVCVLRTGYVPARDEPLFQCSSVATTGNFQSTEHGIDGNSTVWNHTSSPELFPSLLSKHGGPKSARSERRARIYEYTLCGEGAASPTYHFLGLSKFLSRPSMVHHEKEPRHPLGPSLALATGSQCGRLLVRCPRPRGVRGVRCPCRRRQLVRVTGRRG